MIQCLICNAQFEKRVQLTSHIQYHHKDYNSQTYYDKYLKPAENAGFCLVCGKPTKFRGLDNGYQRYCSDKCAWQDPGVKNKRALTIAKKSDAEKKVWQIRNVENRLKKNSGQYLSAAEKQKRYEKSCESFKEYLKESDCTFISYDLDNRSAVTFRCNKCGHESTYVRSLIDRMARQNDYTICHFCNNHKSVSRPEKELREFVVSIYDGDIMLNDRKLLNGHELDIVLPEKKLAIEFDGLYWHNENCVHNKYHLEKTEQCEKLGYQLIHIFEDEWTRHSEIVKSRIRGLLGCNERIYARKTECKEISYAESKEFLEKNHIQGNCTSKYRYGLFYNNELVSVMTFGKSRFKDEFELLRFANKLDTNVIGGAGKLLHHFLADHNDITELVSYADRRWSKGNLYEKLGFSFVSKTAPSYFYIVNHERRNRVEFQKHKLVAAGYDASKTETEIMKELGYLRIFDCGTLKFRLDV